MKNFKGRKVLVMGLGLLGGGVAVTKWLVRHGAKVTVTDLKTRKELVESVKEIENYVKKARPVRGRTPQGARSAPTQSRRAASNGVKFVLGQHKAEDFKNNEIIVVNPGVPRESNFLKIAKKSGARLENEASIFFHLCKNPIIGVTGTRGKTTIVNWLHHILKKKFPKAVLTGNSSDNPMLGVLDKLDSKHPVVVELSSWHLELLPKSKKSPHIAVITNIYPDHLNRYPSIRSYASAKANIFKYQTRKDFLILNRKNKWTKFFLKKKPKGKIVYFPAKTGLAKSKFIEYFGKHNFENMAAAVQAARVFGVSESIIKSAIRTLPKLQYRQEVIIKKRDLTIVNDTTATTPEAAIAAMERFYKKGTLILVAGGGDKKLDFTNWAKIVKRCVYPENLFLINGGATKKMVLELEKINYFFKSKPKLFEDLFGLLKTVRGVTGLRRVILFSPAATSFEKFQNEFDRGRQFNLYSKKLFV